MKALVIAEHDNQGLSSGTYATITAAQQLADTDVLLAGYGCRVVAEQAAMIPRVGHVLLCDAERYQHPLAENLTALVMMQASHYDYLLAPASTFGRNLMPRVAACLNVSQISDVIEVVSKDTFKRPMYAGNAIATVQALDAQKVMTVRPTAFPAASIAQTQQATISLVEPASVCTNIKFDNMQASKSSRPELTSANVIVAGGRGLQNKESFALLEQLADTLHAAVGASRAAVDAGFVPNDYQVGQTGKVVAPDLYIAVGISGAVQHLAGMKDSKVIVAINKDSEAPIFQYATYGIVGDLFDIIPKMITLLNEEK